MEKTKKQDIIKNMWPMVIVGIMFIGLISTLSDPTHFLFYFECSIGAVGVFVVILVLVIKKVESSEN